MAVPSASATATKVRKSTPSPIPERVGKELEHDKFLEALQL
jgi:hypothetical protein